jgi:hypothetical protein
MLAFTRTTNFREHGCTTGFANQALVNFGMCPETGFGDKHTKMDLMSLNSFEQHF